MSSSSSPARPASDPPAPMGYPLLRLAFRPFYLLAALVAALAIPLWVARYYGWLPGLPNVGLYWHVHEMVFGFAIAVIIGFLYTAGRAWTGLDTPRGLPLALLALLWIGGRVAMLVADPVTAAVVDCLFLPVAAVPLYLVLKRAGNKRNLFLILLLALLAAANIAYHCALLGGIALSPLVPVEGAILVIVLLESVIGARVIPGFTKNTLPGVAPLVNPKRDRVSVALIVLTAVSWIIGLPGPLVAALAAATGLSLLIRLLGWKPWRTWRVPLLWILHLSYAWIVVGFFLLALAALGVVGSSAAFHALTVGSMAGLIIGMLTRTALGHTGRPLKAGRAETTMYVLVQLGALLRLCAALAPPAWREHALLSAAACWSAAFLLYLAVYGPYLFRARIDGRDG